MKTTCHYITAREIPGHADAYIVTDEDGHPVCGNTVQLYALKTYAAYLASTFADNHGGKFKIHQVQIQKP